MDVPITEQSDFNPVSAVKKLRSDFERRLRTITTEPFPIQTFLDVPLQSEPKAVGEPKVIVVRKIHSFYRRPCKAGYRGRAASKTPLLCTVPKYGLLRFLDFSNHTLTLIGITGLTFAVLCLLRGFHSDLSLGYPVCASGLAMIGTGLAGRFLAK
ncbi:MAG: hypothetical protein LBT46_07475 [Planctomycetaceae bacterium]|jgi:hypothetical protein|nr:hypothetical protein [Planctomycetaceae bacterium]